MFPQFKRNKNESGIVLFMVLMTTIIILIISAGILIQSMNEINFAQQQIDQITSDQLAKGIFWNAYSNSYLESGGNISISTVMVMNNRTYNINITGSNGVYNTSVNYDTFN